MATITMQLPDELQARLARGGLDAGSTLRLAAAFSLCQRGELSTSQAADLAGLCYSDFLSAAANAEVELFALSANELTEQLNRG